MKILSPFMKFCQCVSAFEDTAILTSENDLGTTASYSFVPNYFDPNFFWSKLSDLPPILQMIYMYLCFNIYIYIHTLIHVYIHMCVYIKHEKMCFHYHKRKKTQHLWHLLTQHKEKNDTLPRPNEKSTQPPIPYTALVIALVEVLVLKVSTLCCFSLIKHTHIR